MTEDVLKQIVLGAPNFVGFIMLTFVLMRIIGKQFDLIRLLINKWEACEDDTEKTKLLKPG